jgi:hypothetical protein
MTLTKFARPRGPLALRLMAVAAAASLIGLGACNESFIPNYNFPTRLTATQLGFTNAVFGVYNGRADAGNWATWTSGMTRISSYFTNSESRFLSELTGKFAIQPDDFIGGTVWDVEFDLIKTADSAQALIPALVASGAESPADAQINWAIVETGKAMNYMYPLMSRDSLGIPINAVGQINPPFAPFLCNQVAWASIIAMFDSAADSLNAAGPGTRIVLSLPAGLASIADSARGFQSLTYALRAKARIEYAYAIARAANANTGTLTGAAAAQLDSAQLDIDSVAFFNPVLTASEAVMPNDAGVFFAYSTQGNDITNPIFGFIQGYNALKVYVDSVVLPAGDTVLRIDTLDNRWTAKFIHKVDANGNDVIPSAVFDSLATGWTYSNNLTGGTPLPIVRNLELQFMLARTQIGLGDLPGAISTLNKVRTAVGGVAPRTVAATPVPVEMFFIDEAKASFIAEGSGQDLMAIRDFGLENVFLTTWGNIDTKATLLPVPVTESQPRNGNVTPDCSGAASHAAPTPKAVKVAPKKAMPNAATGMSTGRTIKMH